MLFNATRPAILNGIEDVVTRPDVADRAIFLTLEPIPEERRRPEAQLWAAFEAERPGILGVLLDAMVEGLKRLPETHLPKLPRMGDFALWATACETALWPSGTFVAAYCGNRDEVVENVLEADPIAIALRALMVGRTEWTGTAAELLDVLSQRAGERVIKGKTWPGGPRGLSGRLRRLAPFLRKIGLEIAFQKSGERWIRIIRSAATSVHVALESRGVRPSAPSAPSAPTMQPNPANDFAAPDLRTVANDADGRLDQPVGTARTNVLKCNGAGDADGADANVAAQSAGKSRWSARL